jgi:hypothetical protein
VQKGSTGEIEMMVVVPDDDDSDDVKLIEDTSDRTGSGGIVVTSSSSSSRTRVGGGRKLETPITTTKKRRAHLRADVELEARIEQIRGRYRQQERILEEEIARLEETYLFSLAELDKAGHHLSQVDLDGRSTDGSWDLESTSEYPPTEPRGMSRSPSPIYM